MKPPLQKKATPKRQFSSKHSPNMNASKGSSLKRDSVEHNEAVDIQNASAAHALVSESHRKPIPS